MKIYTFIYNDKDHPVNVIAKSELKDGAYYRGHCRNAVCDLARWDATTNKFYYVRSKFGYIFVEPIEHPEDEVVNSFGGHYDVFCVTEHVAKPNFEIPIDGSNLDKEKIKTAPRDHKLIYSL